MLHAVIMAGGSGTRFWPESRAARPKQLLKLAGDRTMIQATVDRLGSLVTPERTLVATNARLVPPISEQLDLPPASYLAEPCKRDTAPCIGMAAFRVLQNDPDATMVVLPADHLIGPDEVFQKTLATAAALVEENPTRLVTLGIKPTYPAEIFGYIHRGEALGTDAADGLSVSRVAAFKEKPNFETAEKFLASGDYFWNAGIFIWKARTILDELAAREPEMYAHLEAIDAADGTPDYAETLNQEFEAIKGKSIDYAVMEHAAEVVVIEAPFDWDDVGTWQALSRVRGTDESGNTVSGQHLGLETNDCIIRTQDGHMVVTLGVENLIVVQTPDATLVADKNKEESIRKLVKLLEAQGLHDYL